MDAEQRVVIASNRGPVALVRDDAGAVVEKRGVGGLVTAVGGALYGRKATWIAAPITDDDRARASSADASININGFRVRLADIDGDLYDAYYNEFSNRILWFLHHHLWEPARGPAFEPHEEEHWDAYREVNQRFASLIAEEAPWDALCLPQDYHLSLVPDALRKFRPDLRVALYWHIPFCQPDQYRILPDAWGTALLEGMLAADLIGFQTDRWATNFIACVRDVLGARARGKTITFKDRETRVGVYPVGVNEQNLSEEAARPEVDEHLRQIDEMVGDRALILRVDRTELSKNIMRGLIAYETMLERKRALRERVVHLILLAPSRRDVPEYRRYIDDCRLRAERINDRFGTPDWKPIILEIEDNFPRTLAAYRRYDVLVVNPVYDGMNLVAREGPTLNERDGVLVPSRNAGAAAELSPAALIVNPFDTLKTATAIETALELGGEERRRRAVRLRKLARGTPPDRWLDEQTRDLTRLR
ncbi:MAG: trehalose-6-phosphate synthase [Actinomycetota bacterium]